MNEYKNFVGGILEKGLLSFMLSSIDKLHQPKSKTLVFTTPAPKALWNKNKGPITKTLHVKVTSPVLVIPLEHESHAPLVPLFSCGGTGIGDGPADDTDRI